MRSPLLLTVLTLTLAACSEPGVAPNDPLARAPTVQLSQLGGDPPDDLCGGLSPCDAYDYRGDGSIGAPGMCFLPPTVDNHLSDPACSGDFTPGLSGVFQIAWCQVDYLTGPLNPPEIGTCQDPSDWQDLVEENGHYAASVRWRRSEADDGDIFRVYVVRGDQTFAHRDLIINPNFTPPADEYVHAIGYSNEPIKLHISDDFSCIKYDTQEGTSENAATCVISGATTVSFDTEQMITTFNFPDGNPTFLADFEVSECLSLGFYIDEASELKVGNALVDVPLADCKISLSSEEISLDVPGEILVTVTDERWDTEFQDARLNVLQYDEFGIGALPPAVEQVWFGTSGFATLRWIGRGLDMLASLILPEPLYAARTSGWDFTRMSDFQVGVMPVMESASIGTACVSGAAHCLDLGTFSGTDPVPVSVQVSAPYAAAPTGYPDNHIDVPDARLHFFPESGPDAVSCPTGSVMTMTETRGCVPADSPDYSTDPPSSWDHVVVVTGDDGTGSVDWTLAGGENTLHVVACGVARPGDNEPESPSNGVWGDLSLSGCEDREAAITVPGENDPFDNGPANGFTPFEPVDTDNEVAIYGLPLEFVARTCPTLDIDGVREDGWLACADATVFTAPQKGPKVSDNATLYTYSDGDSLYIGVEVATSELGNKIFINLTDGVETIGGVEDGVEAAGDDVLVIDQLGVVDGGSFGDWHYTAACVRNNSASLCGDPDVGDDGTYAAFGAAQANGAGPGTVFYEFVRPLDNPVPHSPKEDLAASHSDRVGLRLSVTQGQGGGKGGFVFPDPQTSSAKYHVFTIE